jgi:hypothetical protein
VKEIEMIGELLRTDLKIAERAATGDEELI